MTRENERVLLAACFAVGLVGSLVSLANLRCSFEGGKVSIVDVPTVEPSPSVIMPAAPTPMEPPRVEVKPTEVPKPSVEAPKAPAVKTAREIASTSGLPPMVAKNWSAEELAGFLREQAGIELDLGNEDVAKKLTEALSRAERGFMDAVKLGAQETEVIRLELEKQGRYVEAPKGAPFPPIDPPPPGTPYSTLERTFSDGMRRSYLIDGREFPELFERRLERQERVFESLIGDALEISEEVK